MWMFRTRLVVAFVLVMLAVGTMSGCSKPKNQALNEPQSPVQSDGQNSQQPGTIQQPGTSPDSQSQSPYAAAAKDGSRVALYFSEPQANFVVPVSKQVDGPIDLGKALAELMNGPRPEWGLGGVIRPEAKLLEHRVEDDKAWLDFNREFFQYGGTTYESLMVASLVGVARQFEDIERINLLKESQVQRWLPEGSPALDIEVVRTSPREGAIAYYALISSTNRVFLTPVWVHGAPDPLTGLDALTRIPPRQGNQVLWHKTLPDGVTLKKFEVKGDTAYVDFSGDLASENTSLPLMDAVTAKALVIDSVVLTATEYPEIRQVIITSEGKPFAGPVERPKWINPVD